MEFLKQFIDVFFNLLVYAIIGRILLSWFGSVNTSGRIGRFLYDITEPILRVARRILPPIGMLDFSPILAIVALDVIRGLLLKFLV